MSNPNQTHAERQRYKRGAFQKELQSANEVIGDVDPVTNQRRDVNHRAEHPGRRDVNKYFQEQDGTSYNPITNTVVPSDSMKTHTRRTSAKGKTAYNSPSLEDLKISADKERDYEKAPSHENGSTSNSRGHHGEPDEGEYDPVTGQRQKYKPVRMHRGAYDRQAAKDSKNIDPITGQHRTGPKYADPADKEAAALHRTPSTTSYDPITGEERQASGQKKRGVISNEVRRSGADVDPITGKSKSEASSGNRSSGSLKTTYTGGKDQYNPITGARR